MSAGELVKGLSSAGAVRLEITAFTKLTGIAQGLIATGLAMIEIGAAMKIFASAMADFGGMLSFEVKGGRAAGVKLETAQHLVTVAVSLGDAETLIEHPASMTHSTYTEEELAASGIAAGLIRLSVGLENAEDLIADLKQALDTL